MYETIATPHTLNHVLYREWNRAISHIIIKRFSQHHNCMRTQFSTCIKYMVSTQVHNLVVVVVVVVVYSKIVCTYMNGYVHNSRK